MLTTLKAIPPPSEELSSTEKLIQMWMHGHSPNTQRYYGREARRFLSFVNKPLDRVTVEDMQAYADYLATTNLSAASQGQSLSTIKSLFSYANKKIAVLPANVAGAVELPKVKDRLSERILPEVSIHLMIALETNQRNSLVLKLLYAAGLRVSELCGLKWRDLQPRVDAGQVTVYGKGGKTRAVLLPESVWDELMEWRGDADIDDPVFPSRKGKGKGHLTTVQVFRIVKEAAQRIPGIDPKLASKVSPHWLRHAHASHSLDRGAPIHLVQQTLGHSNVATTGRYLHARPQDSSARFLVF